MSNAKYVKSIVAMASATGARDNGTRLIKVQEIIGQIQNDAGPDLQNQSRALGNVLIEVKKALGKGPDDAQYLVEITDLFATKQRHLADSIA